MDYLLKYGLDYNDLNALLEENDKSYIESFTEDMIRNNSEVLKKYGIDFIGELVIADIGIFVYSSMELEKRLKIMIEKLGPSYLDIINDDISILIDFIYNIGNI